MLRLVSVGEGHQKRGGKTDRKNAKCDKGHSMEDAWLRLIYITIVPARGGKAILEEGGKVGGRPRKGERPASAQKTKMLRKKLNMRVILFTLWKNGPSTTAITVKTRFGKTNIAKRRKVQAGSYLEGKEKKGSHESVTALKQRFFRSGCARSARNRNLDGREEGKTEKKVEREEERKRTVGEVERAQTEKWNFLHKTAFLTLT